MTPDHTDADAGPPGEHTGPAVTETSADVRRAEIVAALESHHRWWYGSGQGEQLRLSGADLAGIDLSGLDLGGVVLDEANLGGARLTGACLCGAGLIGTVLRGANLAGCDLAKAEVIEADLSDADLRGAVLLRADLRQSRLCRAALDDADLLKTDLLWTDLTGASLRRANLEKTLFHATVLDGVDATAATGAVPPGTVVIGGVEQPAVAALNRFGGRVEQFEIGRNDRRPSTRPDHAVHPGPACRTAVER